MSRPATGRRIDIRREATFGRGVPAVPYSSRLLLGFLADRDIGLVSGNVAVWGDVAGSNDLVQATLANQPPYSAANPAFSNRPAVGPGNGTTQFMRTSGNVDLTAQTDITHALVFRYGGNGLIYDAGAIGAFGGFFVNSSGVNVLLRFLATAGAQQAIFAATVGTVYRLIYVLHVNSGTTYPTLYINGVAGTPGGTSDRGFSAPRTHTLLARQDAAGSWSDSTVAASLIYGGALTAPEIVALDAWLQANFT